MLQQVKEYVEQTPDSVKLITAGVAPVTTYFLGLPLQEWTYILSIILTLLFIIEKVPKTIATIKLLIRKIRRRDAPS